MDIGDIGDLRGPLNHALNSPAGPHVWLNPHINLYSASTPVPAPRQVVPVPALYPYKLYPQPIFQARSDH